LALSCATFGLKKPKLVGKHDDNINDFWSCMRMVNTLRWQAHCSRHSLWRHSNDSFGRHTQQAVGYWML